MALYIGEEQVWKCPKHPSKRRPNGICPSCLRDRLCILCPDCANVRPCGCSATATSSSSSSSSLFSSFSSSSRTTASSAAVGRVGSLIESEPKFQRSRSLAIPFTRSRFSTSGRENLVGNNSVSDHKLKTTSFWSIFKNRKGKTEAKNDGHDEANHFVIKDCYLDTKVGEFERMLLKSRSMRPPIRSENGGEDLKSSSKGKSWHLPSPIKVFRQRSKVVQDRSPLQR